MSVKVEQVKLSSSGKAHRVLLSGKWYGAGKELKMDTLVGQEVEASCGTTEYGPWIEAVKPVGSAQVATSSSPASKTETKFAEPADKVALNISEPELRFISNVVGQAILAKTCVDPDDVTIWAQAAKRALKSLI